MLGKEEIPLGKMQTKETKVLSEEDIKIPHWTAIASITRLETPNEKEGVRYQVTKSSKLAEESGELTILSTVVEKILIGNVPIVIANTGQMWASSGIRC